MDDHRESTWFDARQSARYRCNRAWHRVLPARLVAGMQRARAARLRLVQRRFSQPQPSDRLRPCRPHQRLTAASIVLVPRETGFVRAKNLRHRRDTNDEVSLAQLINRPPETLSDSPVVCEESLEARKSAALATSSC